MPEPYNPQVSLECYSRLYRTPSSGTYISPFPWAMAIFAACTRYLLCLAFSPLTCSRVFAQYNTSSTICFQSRNPGFPVPSCGWWHFLRRCISASSKLASTTRPPYIYICICCPCSVLATILTHSATPIYLPVIYLQQHQGLPLIVLNHLPRTESCLTVATLSRLRSPVFVVCELECGL